MSNGINADIKDLLQIAIQVIGRIAIPHENVRTIVGTNSKYIKAFNLCDGTLTQSEIARKAKIKRPNLSRAMNRWVTNGILFLVGKGVDARFIHIYPIPEKTPDWEKK